MSDRELLELAAKAAGIKRKYFEFLGEWGLIDDDPDGGWWNPLLDDGDALRLAVQLRLNLDFGTHESIPYVCADRHGIEMVRDPVSAVESSYEQEIVDWCAATRRAIVRAAAEIGRSKHD